MIGCDTDPHGVESKCIDQLDYLPFDHVIKRTEGTCIDIAVTKTEKDGATKEEDVWKMMGLLTFLDPHTAQTIRLSVENGVAVKMITGDHLLIAMETARVLDLCYEGDVKDGAVPIIAIAEGLSWTRKPNRNL